MLSAVVLECTTEASIPVYKVQGEGAYQLFSETVSFLRGWMMGTYETKPHFSTAVYDITPSDNEGLSELEKSDDVIPQGSSFKVRLTFMDDPTIFTMAVEEYGDKVGFTPALPISTGDDTVIHVDSISFGKSGNEWAGFVSVSELVRAAEKIDLLEKVTIEFKTPTLFQGNRYPTPLPTPRCVFGALITTWKRRFKLLNVPDTVLKELFSFRIERILNYKAGIHYSYDWKTGMITAVPGFTGVVVLVPPEEISRRAVFWADFLSKFAFYSGAGMNVDKGMGMCRALHDVEAVYEDEDVSVAA